MIRRRRIEFGGGIGDAEFYVPLWKWLMRMTAGEARGAVALGKRTRAEAARGIRRVRACRP